MSERVSLKLGQKTGGVPVSDDVRDKIKSLYMAESFTEQQIADDCGVSLRFVQSFVKKGDLKEERQRRRLQLHVESRGGNSDLKNLSNEEIGIRANAIKFSQMLRASLSDHFLIKDAKGKIIGRKKNLPIKDLKMCSDILKTTFSVELLALGGKEVGSTDHMKIAETVIKIINMEIADPALRGRIAAKLENIGEEK